VVQESKLNPAGNAVQYNGEKAFSGGGDLGWAFWGLQVVDLVLRYATPMESK